MIPSQALEIPTKPQEPNPEECCQSCCDPCIYDYYYKALAKWEDKIKTMGLEPDTLRY